MGEQREDFDNTRVDPYSIKPILLNLTNNPAFCIYQITCPIMAIKMSKMIFLALKYFALKINF